jgi:hypothetical protein
MKIIEVEKEYVIKGADLLALIGAIRLELIDDTRKIIENLKEVK